MEADRTMWAREARKVENKIAHRLKLVADAKREIPALEARHDELLKKIADDYAEEHGS